MFLTNIETEKNNIVNSKIHGSIDVIHSILIVANVVFSERDEKVQTMFSFLKVILKYRKHPYHFFFLFIQFDIGSFTSYYLRPF